MFLEAFIVFYPKIRGNSKTVEFEELRRAILFSQNFSLYGIQALVNAAHYPGTRPGVT